MSLIAPRPARRAHAYEDLGDVELSPEEAALAVRKTREAERELADVRITLRWGRKQLATIRRAAALSGVPYQAYLKQAAFAQAVRDLRDARGADAPG